jgi:hypothetical protein
MQRYYFRDQKSSEPNRLGDKPCTTNNLPPSTLPDHLPCSCAVAIKNPIHIDLKHASDIVFRQLEKCFDLCNAGVCDHNVEGAEILDCGFDEAFDFGELGNVRDVAIGFTTEALDLFYSLEKVCY